MVRIRILYDVKGWAYHRRAENLARRAPTDMEVSIASLEHASDVERTLGDSAPDLVFVLPIHEVELVRSQIQRCGWPTRVVGSWNSGWPLQVSDFGRAYASADAMVINNRMAWEKTGRLPRTHPIENGVDLEIFHPRVAIDEREPRVLWTGSESGRERKRYDEILLPLQDRLRSADIPCELLLVDSYAKEKRNSEEMAAWYNEGTILVCASSVEGTPNPALEAAACGCTVVTTPVGNMPELIHDDINGYLVRADTEEFYQAVQRAISNYPRLAQAMQVEIRRWDWKHTSKRFYGLFRDVLESAPKRFSP